MAERIARENEERQKSEEEMAKRLKASQEVGRANYIFLRIRYYMVIG